MRSLINCLKEKEFTIADLCLLLILAAQFCFLAYVNLFCNAALNDFDASGAYVHILEVYKSKSLFPATYGYATTMDVDSTVWLGALIFAICKNVFVAQGICNILVILAYLFVIREIFTAVHGSRQAMRITMILILIPYSMGMVGYWNVMFVGVAANTIRNLIPLLYVSVLLDLNDHGMDIKCAVKAIASLLLMLITSISAGFYVMLFGIMSLILCDLFLWIQKGEFKEIFQIRFLLHGLMAVTCVLGMLIQRRLSFTPKAAGQNVVLALNFPQNIGSWFMGIFEMFGALPEEGEVKLFSIIGIDCALKYGITFFFLGVFLYHLHRFLRNRTAPAQILYVLFIGVVDAMTLLFLNTTYGTLTYEYRYHIMPMLFVILLGGFFVDELLHSENALLKKVLTFAAVAGLAFTLCLADYVALLYIDFVDAPLGEVRSSENLKTIDDYIEANDIDTAIVYSDVMSVEGRKLRAYGDTTDYVLVSPSDGSPAYGWGGSSRAHEKNGATGKTVILTTEAEYESLPAEIKEQTTLLGQIVGLDVYRIPEGVFPL